MPLPIIQHYFNDCDILINKWMDPATNRSLLSSDPFLSNSPVLSGSPYYDAMPEPFLGDPEDNLAVIVDLNPDIQVFLINMAPIATMQFLTNPKKN